jgi:hypothetical protein
MLACYATGPTTQMTPSYLHPSMSDVQKRIQLEPVINEIEDKSMNILLVFIMTLEYNFSDRRQIMICNNEAVWSEQ